MKYKFCTFNDILKVYSFLKFMHIGEVRNLMNTLRTLHSKKYQ